MKEESKIRKIYNMIRINKSKKKKAAFVKKRIRVAVIKEAHNKPKHIPKSYISKKHKDILKENKSLLR